MCGVCVRWIHCLIKISFIVDDGKESRFHMSSALNGRKRGANELITSSNLMDFYPSLMMRTFFVLNSVIGGERHSEFRQANFIYALKTFDGMKIRADMPVLREKSSSLRVHSQTHERAIRLPTGKFLCVKDQLMLVSSRRWLIEIASEIWPKLVGSRSFRPAALTLKSVSDLENFHFFGRNFSSFRVRCDCAGDENSRTNGKLFIHKFCAFLEN